MRNRTKKLNRQLDLIIDYANEQEESRLRKKLTRIVFGPFAEKREKKFERDKEGKRKPNDSLLIGPPLQIIDHRYPTREDSEQATALEIQIALCKDLQKLIDKKDINTELSGTVLGGLRSNGWDMTVVDPARERMLKKIDPRQKDEAGQPEETVRYLSNVALNLMFFLGIRGVKKCPVCNKFFLLRGKPNKTYCGNKCRQQNFRDTRTKEQRHEIGMRRAALREEKKIIKGES